MLQHKLSSYGIAGGFFSIIKSILTGQSLNLVISSQSSKAQAINTGVLPGSLLGLTLILLYTNDLLKSINRSFVHIYAVCRFLYCHSIYLALPAIQEPDQTKNRILLPDMDKSCQSSLSCLDRVEKRYHDVVVDLNPISTDETSQASRCSITISQTFTAMIRYTLLIVANYSHSFQIPLVTCNFHLKSFLSGNTILWNQLTRRCFPDHCNLNLFNLWLIFTFTAYSHKLCLFLCHSLSQVAFGPCTGWTPLQPLPKQCKL